MSTTIEQRIQGYIDSQPDPKRNEMLTLHQLMRQKFPESRLSFTDGKNDEGKVVSNPNIGYGSYTIRYADGATKDFYRIGLSANTTGISVYVLGLADKTYLAQNFGKELGKASVTGYCIKFKKLADIDLEVLFAAIRYGIESA